MKSIVSYPERGMGGRNSYRGNCSPKLIEDIVAQFSLCSISDYMVGSGTTEDVAKRLGIECHAYDLNRGFDLMSMDIPERNQAIFWHPPYGDMITYSGEQYDAEKVRQSYGIDPIACDLSRIHNWEQFVQALNFCMMKQFNTLERGGRMFVLMGDMKRKGRLYSMLTDIAKPGILEQIVIKAQHNCISDGRTYGGKFIPIVHEYLMIVKKDSGLIFTIKLTQDRQVDLRDLGPTVTWRDIVYGVLEDHRRPMKLKEVYDAIDGHRRTKTNHHWHEKIRQTLQNERYFRRVEEGVYSLAA